MKPVGDPFHNLNDYNALRLRRRIEERDSNQKEASRPTDSMGMNVLRKALPARNDSTEKRRERDSHSYSKRAGRPTSSSAPWENSSSCHSSTGMKPPQTALRLSSDRTMPGNSSTVPARSTASFLLSSGTLRNAAASTEKKGKRHGHYYSDALKTASSSREYHRTQYQASSQGSASSMRYARSNGYEGEPGCVVSAIATVAGVDYRTARAKAAEIADFNGAGGMNYTDAGPVLDSLGVSNSRHMQHGWDSLPNLALITVHGRHSDAEHAVVFRRKNGQEYIYDRHNDGVIRHDSGYVLKEDASYLDIRTTGCGFRSERSRQYGR